LPLLIVKSIYFVFDQRNNTMTFNGLDGGGANCFPTPSERWVRLKILWRPSNRSMLQGQKWK